MPFTHRPDESVEDRNQRMTNTADAFVLWASEFGLIDVVVDEDGEVGFVRPACEHELEYDDDEVFYAEQMEDAPASSFHAPRHAAKSASRRLPAVALPVAASLVLASTAAYAAHRVTHSTPSVRVPAAAGPVVAAKAAGPKVRKNLVAHPVPSLPQNSLSARDVLEHLGDVAATPRIVFVAETGEDGAVVPAAWHKTRGNKVPSVIRRSKHVALPEQASEQAKEVVNTAPGRVKRAVKDTVKQVVKAVPSVTLPSTPAIPVPGTPVVVPPVVVPPVVTPPVVDTVLDTTTNVVVGPVVDTLP